MPAYTKLNMSELREECDERGINYAGLNKKGIITLLRRDDESQIRQENNDVEDDGEEDGEVQIRAPSQSQQTRNGGVMGQCGGDSDMGGNGGSDSSVALMQLKLQLAIEERERMERAWEIEKERAELGLNVAGQATADSSQLAFRRKGGSVSFIAEDK